MNSNLQTEHGFKKEVAVEDADMQEPVQLGTLFLCPFVA